MPCFIRWPGRLPAGSKAGGIVAHLDLAPTLLAACGLATPAGVRFDGVNLLPLLEEDKPRERTFYWRIERSDRKQRAVRHGNWKYLRDGGIELLFDLADDPGERRTLAWKHPEKVAELRQKLAAWEKDVDSEKPAFRVR